MIILFEPKDSIKITSADLDLSKTQQKTLLELMKNPKMASEIEKETEMPLTTILVALRELKGKEMVFSEKPEIKLETTSGIISKKSDIEYWQLTDKGMLWVTNVYGAINGKMPKDWFDKLKEKFPKISSCVL